MPDRHPEPYVVAESQTETYTVMESKIYDFVINADMSEEDAIKEMAARYEISAEEVEEIANKVMAILFKNKWMGMSSEELLKRASDYSEP